MSSLAKSTFNPNEKLGSQEINTTFKTLMNNLMHLSGLNQNQIISVCTRQKNIINLVIPKCTKEYWQENYNQSNRLSKEDIIGIVDQRYSEVKDSFKSLLHFLFEFKTITYTREFTVLTKQNSSDNTVVKKKREMMIHYFQTSELIQWLDFIQGRFISGSAHYLPWINEKEGEHVEKSIAAVLNYFDYVDKKETN